MMNSSGVVLVCAAILLLTGCRSGVSNNGGSEADAQSIVNSGFGWQGGSVEVCYLNTPTNSSVTDIVSMALKGNFQKAVVGLEYTGFKSCQASPNAPAKVWFFNDENGSAYSKYVGRYKYDVQMPYDSQGATVALPDEKDETYLYNTTIHEFGHFAGLFHEQSRLENFNGSLCSRQEKGNFKELEIRLPGSLPKQLGEFDRMSIMNYCIQGYFSQFLKLSAGDIKALRLLYSSSWSPSAAVSPEKNPAELCNIMTVTKSQIPERKTIQAFSDEKMTQIVGELPEGTELVRLLTKPINSPLVNKGENLTAMQVIPK
ncbi:MAG: hypothetical protein EBR09_15060, partial [Proteobacteria bacterium]|nr:hypothetical protein [Pseudomonadota bacterium]